MNLSLICFVIYFYLTFLGLGRAINRKLKPKNIFLCKLISIFSKIYSFPIVFLLNLVKPVVPFIHRSGVLNIFKTILSFALGAAALFIVVPIALLFAQLVYANINGTTECLSHKQVERVGGCDAFGSCGVRYTDGTIGTAKKPIANQYVCTEFNHLKPDTGWW